MMIMVMFIQGETNESFSSKLGILSEVLPLMASIQEPREFTLSCLAAYRIQI